MKIKKINKPLFMWAGGKTRMIKRYTASGLLPETSNLYNTVDNYVEPFFGGGAMFLHINKIFKPKTCTINDINPSIVNIYTSIKNNYEEFIEEVDILEEKYIPMKKEDRKKYYYELRNQHAFEYTKWPKVKEASYLFFLMKTGFNGLWQINKNTNNRFGTPSGLLHQKENVYDKDNVKFWSDILQSTTITCKNWKESIPEEKIKNSFYFLDPPYRGSFTSYGQTFDDQAQTDLVTFAKSVSDDSTVFLCNDDVNDNFFQDIQGHLKIESYQLKHTAGRRATNADGTKSAKSVKEIVMYNNKINGSRDINKNTINVLNTPSGLLHQKENVNDKEKNTIVNFLINTFLKFLSKTK